ncbi:MAG TPA: LysE family transporter [Rhizomicrobium sp.]|jgi:threonine/homoserine/homoserine lactone efflux protein|nr:LysE family transporter [Rhizomicrobium sp.]
MVYFVTIFVGFFIGLIAAIPIGPVNLLVVRRTLAYDPMHGFMSGLGAVLADAVYACITAFGFTALAQMIKGHSTTLEIIGGLMLFFFGARMYFAPPNIRLDEGEQQESKTLPLLRAMASTFALAVTNPATLFAFTAMFAGAAGVVGQEASFYGTAFLVLGVLSGSTFWWFALTTITGLFHRHIDERVMRIINKVSGVIVTAFGIGVFAHLILRVH